MQFLKKISPLRMALIMMFAVLFGAGAMAINARAVHPRWVPPAGAVRLTAAPAKPDAALPQSAAVPSQPASYTETGKILFITRRSPTTYFSDKKGVKGFEYELAEAFAKFLGVKAEFRVLDTENEVLEAMEAGQGDVAAAGLVHTSERERLVTFGPDYLTVDAQVVCRIKGPSCRKVIGLVKHKVLVAAGSNNEEILKDFKDKKYPGLDWTTVSGEETGELGRLVVERKADYAIMNSNLVAMERRMYPSLVAAFALSQEIPLAWAVNPSNGDLLSRLYIFMEQESTGKLIQNLKAKYFGRMKPLGRRDVTAFHDKVKSRLPLLELKFRRAAKDHGLDWRVLAAVAYQESMWEEDARSSLGVKGLMMITDSTAASLGITDPYDADQSIRGGARYLARLLREVPKSVKGKENRLRYALVAYNIGSGHLKDARRLARRLGKDPDSWKDMKDVLPLLSLKAYHKDLACGYARGAECVRYVSRIFSYREILEHRGMQMLPKLRLNEAAKARKKNERLAEKRKEDAECTPAS